MSFYLEQINILFHDFPACSSGLLCLFLFSRGMYLFFCSSQVYYVYIHIQSRQFYFDSYLYVKWGKCPFHCHRSCSPAIMLKQLFSFLWNRRRHPPDGLACYSLTPSQRRNAERENDKRALFFMRRAHFHGAIFSPTPPPSPPTLSHYIIPSF